MFKKSALSISDTSQYFGFPLTLPKLHALLILSINTISIFLNILYYKCFQHSFPGGSIATCKFPGIISVTFFFEFISSYLKLRFQKEVHYPGLLWYWYPPLWVLHVTLFLILLPQLFQLLPTYTYKLCPSGVPSLMHFITLFILVTFNYDPTSQHIYTYDIQSNEANEA